VKSIPKQILIGISIWPFVALILLPIAALSIWDGYNDYRDVMRQEYRVLEASSQQREAQLAASIRKINQVLSSVRSHLQEKRNLSPAEQSQLLRSHLVEAPEARNLVIISRLGRVQSEAKDISVGQDVSTREYFAHHQRAPGDDAPFFARPFLSKAGYFVVTISQVIRGEDDSFQGVALASMDEQFLEKVLKQPVIEAGFEAALMNARGDIITHVPRSDSFEKNLQGSLAYKQHFASNEQTTRHMEQSAPQRIERILVYTNVSDSPLTVIVSKESSVLLNDWLYVLYGKILTFAILTAAIIYLAKVLVEWQQMIASAWQEIALRDNALRNFKSIVASTHDAIIGCDLKGQINTWNHGAETAFGYLEQETLGSSIEQLVPEDRRPEIRIILSRIAQGERVSRFETQQYHKSGGVIDIDATVSPMFNESREVTGAVLIARDVTDRKAYDERLNYLASHDRLTGLPNRELFYDRLSQAISLARRHRDQLAVLFLDLDGFKQINDRHGHTIGDETLKLTAQRLSDCFRECDTVARLGGDEFAVILTEIQTSNDVERIARKAINSISEPMRFGAVEEFCIGVSVGGALFPDAGNEIDRLIQAADRAMYESKQSGKNRFTFAQKYTPGISDERNWIEIGEALQVGIAVIDDQHRTLANMLNRLNGDLAKFAPHDVVLQQLEEIATYVVFHFDTEDQLMVEAKYPETENHRRAHEYLISEMKYLKTRFSQGGELSVLQSLKDWFVKHINAADKSLGTFLKNKLG
jgi:diguanylate cyclase (GGDEF)-like protein/hemerythrin-like metal-binding protein/PAS domain S-box-containing protein